MFSHENGFRNLENRLSTGEVKETKRAFLLNNNIIFRNVSLESHIYLKLNIKTTKY